MQIEHGQNINIVSLKPITIEHEKKNTKLVQHLLSKHSFYSYNATGCCNENDFPELGTFLKYICQSDKNTSEIPVESFRVLHAETVVAHDKMITTLSTLFDEYSKIKSETHQSSANVARVYDMKQLWELDRSAAETYMSAWKKTRDDRVNRIEKALSLCEKKKIDTFPNEEFLDTLRKELCDLKSGINLSQFFFAMSYKLGKSGRPYFSHGDFSKERGFHTNYGNIFENRQKTSLSTSGDLEANADLDFEKKYNKVFDAFTCGLSVRPDVLLCTNRKKIKY